MATLANQMLELEIRIAEDRLKLLKSLYMKNNQEEQTPINVPEKPGMQDSTGWNL